MFHALRLFCRDMEEAVEASLVEQLKLNLEDIRFIDFQFHGAKLSQ